jgi:kinesin family protein 5
MDQLNKPNTDRSGWILNILESMSWNFRLVTLPQLSKGWSFLGKSLTLKQWMCLRLEAENGVYSPTVPPPTIGSFSKMFDELYPLRNMWVPSQQHLLYRQAFEERAAHERFLALTENDENVDDVSSVPTALTSTVTATAATTTAPPPSRYAVGVCVRFRPSRQTPQGESKQEERERRQQAIKKSSFLLPLHQRLQIIKMREKGCTTKKALHLLSKEGSWFDASWKKKPIDANGEDKENDGDFGSGSQEARVHQVDTGRGTVVMVAPSVGMRPFQFDRVLEGRTSQKTAYDLTTKSLVVDMCNGFNASVIMYGQTGSGKTWTCFGPSPMEKGGRERKNRGLVQRACEEVFEAADRRARLGIECHLHVSYVEVYGNEVTDLLKQGERVGHNKVSAQRYVMSGQAKQSVTSLDDIRHALDLGDAQKRRAATAMNDRSSRAHSLFVVTMEMLNVKTGVQMTSELYLADLGGSEQVKKSKVHHGGYDDDTGTALGFQMGKNMKEAVNINLGLLALKKCISALNDGSDYVP